MRWVVVVLAALAAMLAAPAPAHAEPRVALIIGNDQYYNADFLLNNAVNDSNLIAETARRLGFTVIHAINADRAGMIDHLAEFQEALERAGPTATGLFYYAGHASQMDGRNLLWPIDIPPTDVGILNSSVNLAGIIEAFERAGTRRNIIILDACRNDPLEGRRGGPGLAMLDQAAIPPGTVVAYSTAPNTRATDGDEGATNGPYATALAEALRIPGLSIADVLNQAAERIFAQTRGRQNPYSMSSGAANLMLTSGGNVAARAAYDVATEAAAWRQAQASNNLDDVSWFIRTYPDGANITRARARLAELQAAQAAAEQRQRGQNAGYGVVMRSRTYRGPLGERPALEVVSVDSASSFFGELLPGDLVLEINHQAVTTTTDPRAILAAQVAQTRRVDLLVRRGQASYQVAVQMR